MTNDENSNAKLHEVYNELKKTIIEHEARIRSIQSQIKENQQLKMTNGEIKFAKRREVYNELKKITGEQETRIQSIQTSAFQLANYYFVFQGVVLAAISNTTSLKCSDAWFVFTLSLLSAILNLFALYSIASKYVRAMNMHEITLSEYDALARDLQQGPNESNKSPSVNHEYQSINSIDNFPRCKRYFVLGVCVILFLSFTVVTLMGPWKVICKHDNYNSYRMNNGHGECIRLCKGSRCIQFC